MFQSNSVPQSPEPNRLRRRFRLVCASLLLLPVIAQASGPRFVTGPPFFTGPAGVPVGWRQSNLLYFTDPGDLSAAVNHQAADALVAAAAATWNLPVARLTLSRGGALAEHLNGQNVYLDSSGMVFPQDVMAANAAAIPIAVIYDADGSVTDALLGAGAGDPSACRNNAVTESVDRFDPAGYILHAEIILNGRCTGAAPQMQLEMQYKLMRVFGRVLGLAWSQTNDNVFTGVPTPTYSQALRWPVMHPLDIICGLYAYQCLPNPFQLRFDDIASMVAVYPIARDTNPGGGKQPSLDAANAAAGHVRFPTGEGMAGVNVLLKRSPIGDGIFDSWYDVSGVTGALYTASSTSPFVAPPGGVQDSFGSKDLSLLGAYSIAYIPLLPNATYQRLQFSTEPVNPLYTGSLSLGLFSPGNVSPSGSSPTPLFNFYNGAWGTSTMDYTIADAVPMCGDGQDGTASAPIQTPSSGWWKGLLCGMGHASYLAANVRPARTFTVEVTALDESGQATESKAMPVIGLFAPADAAGALPSLGVAAAAFQSLSVGTTSITASTGQSSTLRIGIADQRGHGRPDFAFQARFFYADTVIPAQLPVAGGTVTVSGSGFRSGNTLLINGVAARVTSWTPTTIVASAPAMAVVNAASGTAVDVTVLDRGTSASTTMSAALTYGSQSGNLMKLVSAPAGTVLVGNAAAVPFAVQVLGPDGTTPIAGESVTFSAGPGTGTPGTAQFSACSASSCTLRTDAFGVASSAATPLSAGEIKLIASDGALTQTAAFTGVAQAASMLVVSAPSGSLLSGTAAQTPFAVRVFDSQRNPLPGRAVTFTVPAGAATFGSCFAAVCRVTTDSSGMAALPVIPGSPAAAAPGTVTLDAADGDVHQRVSFTALPNADIMRIVIAPVPSTFLGGTVDPLVIKLFLSDGTTPDPHQPITFTSSPGVTFCPGHAASCTMQTDWSGQAGLSVSVTQTGDYTVQASFGAVTQIVHFKVVLHTEQLRILQAPSGSFPVGVRIATPFVVQLLQDGVTPIVGGELSLAGPQGGVELESCLNQGGCRIYTDSNGIAQTLVTPVLTGEITLTAAYSPYVASASFVSTGQPERMIPTMVPKDGTLAGTPVPFQIQMIGVDGVTPEAGVFMNFRVVSGPFAFSTCIPFCVERTDNMGFATVYGIPYGPGLVTVQAVKDGAEQTMTFMAALSPDYVNIASSPAPGATVGVVAPNPFAVRISVPGCCNAGPNREVLMSVTSGSAGLVACAGASSCTVKTDTEGVASTGVTPFAAGTITLAATEGGGQATADFTAIGPSLADTMVLTSTPGSSVRVGASPASLLAVRVTLSDRITPLAGVSVTFSSSSQAGGSVSFGACGLVLCTVTTDAQGLASTSVTGLSPGSLTLSATGALPSGPQVIPIPFEVIANQHQLTAINLPAFVAEGATLGLTLTATAAENSAPAAAQAIHWTGDSAFRPAVPDSLTTATGLSMMRALLGPLGPGRHASVSACAWSTVCAQFDGVGVALADLRLALAVGGEQAISGNASPVPVQVRVTDSAGHPVGAATVNVSQTLRAVNAACPAHGRCPSAPVVASLVSVMTSAADGTLLLNPLTPAAAIPALPAGSSAQTDIVFTAGTQGFASGVVTFQP